MLNLTTSEIVDATTCGCENPAYFAALARHKVSQQLGFTPFAGRLSSMHQHHPNRHLVNFAAAWCVEELERRTLLSGGVFDVYKIPVYVPTSGDISDPRNGPLGNAGATLHAGLFGLSPLCRNGGGSVPSKFSDGPLSSLQTQGISVAVTVHSAARWL